LPAIKIAEEERATDHLNGLEPSTPAVPVNIASSLGKPRLVAWRPDSHPYKGVAMDRTRFAFALTLAVGALALSCGGGASSAPPASTSAGKSTLPTCRWAPIKPDNEERCTLTTKGMQLNITQRDSMRSQDQRQITVTCVCE
jgi:hypothetical protein